MKNELEHTIMMCGVQLRCCTCIVVGLTDTVKQLIGVIQKNVRELETINDEVILWAECSVHVASFPG